MRISSGPLQQLFCDRVLGLQRQLLVRWHWFHIIIIKRICRAPCACSTYNSDGQHIGSLPEVLGDVDVVGAALHLVLIAVTNKESRNVNSQAPSAGLLGP